MIKLWQFRASPYNEKVRWALDLKRVPHRRRSFLPGLHMSAMKSRTGQSATPILWMGGKWLSNSADIVAALEERFPTPPLYPKDDAARSAVLEIEKRFDNDFGPRMRRATFGQLLTSPWYLGRVFAAGRSAIAQAAYCSIIPLASSAIRRWNGIVGPESIADGERATDEAFAFVSQRIERAPYLVGDQFSLADLTAAAFIAMVCDFVGTPMEKPKPIPGAIAAWLAARGAKPAAVWARDIYKRHRVLTYDFDGLSPKPTDRKGRKPRAY
jgi:glutathione S-transferase